MLNEVGKCTSCGEQNLQVRENVNKRIGMCENLVLFCLSCKKDIYSINTNPQVEKEKKKGVNINLSFFAAVTSLGKGHNLRNLENVYILTFLNHLLNLHQSYLKYLEENR